MSKSRRSDVSLTDSLALFEEHSALFIDKEDGDVYPRLIAGRDEAEIDRVFNTFFSFVATYELSRQWIMEPGEFICEFSWLTTKYNHDEIRDWAAGLFEKAYGVPFEQFGFVAAPSEEAIRLAQKPALGE